MKIVEHLEKAKTNPQISFEIVPPPRGRNVADLMAIVEQLIEINPPFIDVTAHSASAYYHERSDGTIERRIYKKRPGTIGICGIIQNRFKIDTVAHILCEGFTKEETEDALIELNFLGVHNVLALRGDAPNFKRQIPKDRSVNLFASDLIEQINDLKHGRYLHDIENSRALNFGIGTAGYPEKHYEAPNLKNDILNLKRKVEAGAEYIMTQMFFNNQAYFNFVEMCKEFQIDVPIIPGLKVINNVRQLKNLARNFYIDLPDNFVDELTENPNHAAEIGKRWALDQTRELLERGVPDVHFYVMNDASSVLEIVNQVGL